MKNNAKQQAMADNFERMVKDGIFKQGDASGNLVAYYRTDREFKIKLPPGPLPKWVKLTTKESGDNPEPLP